MIDNDELLKMASAAVQAIMTNDALAMSDADRLAMAIVEVIRLHEDAESRQARKNAGME